MWVVSQHSEKVLNCYSFSITKYYALKKYKYAITGEFAHNFWGSCKEILSLYHTKEDALKDLDRLNKSLMKGENLFKF